MGFKRLFNRAKEFIQDPVKGIEQTVEDPGGAITDWFSGTLDPLGIFDPLVYPAARTGPSDGTSFGALPSREETVMNVLSEQMKSIEKRKKNALGSMSESDASAPIASSILLGV